MNKPRRAPRRRVDGVLLLDKPLGLTSNAALQKARWLFNAEKGGHTGTLDPLATGLLPLCFGEATKFAGEFLDADKAYRATLRLGTTTETGDAEGTVREVRPVNISEAQTRATMTEFCGEILQTPPMYSALKRDGKPLYEYARQGVELERQARQVVIHRFELIAFSNSELVVDVDCSKGTYIRTLAEDLGERLGCGAHLGALRRTRSGRLSVASAVTLESLEAMTLEARDACLLPTDALLVELPEIRLNQDDSERIAHGQGVRCHGQAIGPAGSRCRVYHASGAFLGVAILSEEGWLNPKRLVASS